jgi:hypothetical protein
MQLRRGAGADAPAWGKTIISTAFVDNPVHKWPRQLPYSNIWNCSDRFA